MDYLQKNLDAAEFAKLEAGYDADLQAIAWMQGELDTTTEKAKRRFAELSPYNLYFDTIDMGLTTLYEPVGKPDLGHYDSLSELALGRKFGQLLVDCLKACDKRT